MCNAATDGFGFVFHTTCTIVPVPDTKDTSGTPGHRDTQVDTQVDTHLDEYSHLDTLDTGQTSLASLACPVILKIID